MFVAFFALQDGIIDVLLMLFMCCCMISVGRIELPWGVNIPCLLDGNKLCWLQTIKLDSRLRDC